MNFISNNPSSIPICHICNTSKSIEQFSKSQRKRFKNKKTARNFNPIMCMAAKQSLIQVRKLIEPHQTNPENVITPGIFVKKIIEIDNPIIETNAIEEGMIYP